MIQLRRALHHMFTGRASREDGQALVLFATGLIAFAGFVGMSIDVGQLVYTASDVQKIADAAALAAAQDLPAKSTTQENALRGSAVSWGAENGDAVLDVEFPDQNTIEVSATRRVNFTFLKVLGIEGSDVSRSATVFGQNEEITGYTLAATAPFVIWGGARQSQVNPGDQNCDFFTCVGKSYTFLDSNWMNASGKPKLPDWDSSDSNNFKGSIAHGDGAAVAHNGDTMSVGGIGSVEVPAVGTILVIPVVDRAGGNSNMRTFRVAAWVQIEVQPGCTKNGCKGKVLDPATTHAQAGWVGGGSVASPPSLSYTGTTTRLTK